MRSTLPLMVVAALLLAGCSEPTTPSISTPLAPPVTAKGPPAPAYYTVTTRLDDRDGAGTPLSTRSDDFNGSGFATYTETGGATSHVSTTGNGAWQLYLGSQQARTIHLAVLDPGFPVPEGDYYQNVEVYAVCFDANAVAQPLLSMTGGQSNANCTFGLDVSSGRTKYKLVMGQQYPGTGRALVTCTSPAAVACASWTIAPAPGAANAGVAILYRFDTRGALAYVGTYHNSYSVSVAKN